MFTEIGFWQLVLLTVGFVLLALESGFQIGKAVRSRWQEPDPVVGITVQTTLSLVVFLLAFTFGVAAERFNERRVLIIEEANSIGTTFLRADFLPETNKNAIQNLLRKYVDLRLRLARESKLLVDGASESDKLQQELWAQAVLIGRANLGSPVIALFIDSLNETLDLQSKREAAQSYSRIPDTIWGSLYLVTFIGMTAIGYQFGRAGGRSWPACIAVIGALTVVLLLIADLDRPTAGLLRTSQQPLERLRMSFGADEIDSSSQQPGTP